MSYTKYNINSLESNYPTRLKINLGGKFERGTKYTGKAETREKKTSLFDKAVDGLKSRERQIKEELEKIEKQKKQVREKISKIIQNKKPNK